MRIVAAGATGFIGAPLCADLVRAGHTIQVLTRNPDRARRGLPGSVEVIRWDPPNVGGPWLDAVEGADAVINLSGESIASGRWTAARKAALHTSRVGTTTAVVEAMAQAPEGQRPGVLVNASAIGYYGNRGEETLMEASTPGQDFLARLCIDWEAAARRAESLGVRVALLRTGLVLGPGGGVLQRLVLPFRFFAGGPLGSGRQWVSWIHLDDEIGIIRHALEHEQVRGPLNGTAPSPVRMRDLASAIGRTLGRPSWLPAPAFALRLALGELADTLILASQRVLPAATQAAGYQFRYTDLDAALRAILKPTA
jgi:uncharacterized protein (TIGR01777 family)